MISKIMKLSIVILSHNSAPYIKKAIFSSLFADELLIIDDQSTDETVSLITSLKNNKIRIVQHPLRDDFSAQRNFGLQNARGIWVLFIDADEEINSDLQEEILKSIESQAIDGYYIKRRDVFLGKEMQYGELGNISLLRLGKRTGKWIGRVHEVWRIEGQTSVLKNPLFHYSHLTLSSFISKINYYTSIRAEELYKQKRVSSLIDIITYPCIKFFKNYILSAGYKDGIHGYVFATFMSLHSFLVRAKLHILSSSKPT